MKIFRWALLSGLFLVFAGAGVRSAEPEGWGSIKGQVIWGGKDIPERQPINVTQDKAHCLSKGPLLEEKFVVDKNTKGVRWVMVWLASADKPKDANAKIPVHPSLKNLKDKPISFDQPCCAFEPRAFGVIAGQTVIAKNSAPVPHNVKVEGGAKNPTLNQLLPPGAKLEIDGWVPTTIAPVPISCSIHGWMKCYARVFNHPYFAVTNEKGEFEIKNAPAGNFRLILWQEEAGWVAKAKRDGLPITIKPNAELDLGKIELTPPKD